ncbi:hypothetical protein [Mycobacteroides abscessus]|uniref:hypothetical protein n=1 Tax=Mycobacteroides abscessus TaxID=36809 RepID=UPI000D3E0B45|nr:hypothetical protein [Mycobacteroides abscessus]PVA71083.1 hypothetical protein DDJ37_22035 [Mycobacteroides abscessus]
MVDQFGYDVAWTSGQWVLYSVLVYFAAMLVLFCVAGLVFASDMKSDADTDSDETAGVVGMAVCGLGAVLSCWWFVNRLMTVFDESDTWGRSLGIAFLVVASAAVTVALVTWFSVDGGVPRQVFYGLAPVAGLAVICLIVDGVHKLQSWWAASGGAVLFALFVVGALLASSREG